LELDRADVALGSVVVERDTEVVGEAQDVLAVAVQAREEISGWGLPDHAAFAGRDRAGRVGLVPERDDLLIGGAIAGQLAGLQQSSPDSRAR
jgi:hypothetical protein